MCLRQRRRLWWGVSDGAASSLTWPKFRPMTTPPPQHLHRDATPYTIPEGTLIVNCLIMLTHNHEEEDGSHFLFVPFSSSGFPDPWVERAVPFKRGTASFF